ncbi:hypothetical protein FQN54_003806 [Arachnomyces sp. PD_36]|nr:hypothetical protein FQN54_003806 [Arachnomyces sp. PD_36]
MEKSDLDAPFTILSETRKKWTIAIASLVTFLSPVSANIYYPALNPLAHDLHVSTRKIILTITVFMIVQGIGPMMVASYSDVYGRRPIVLLALLLYLGVNIGLAEQTSYPVLMALRCLQSFGSSTATVVCSSVPSDLVPRSERGRYMIYSSLGVTLGPAIGPVLGGVLTQFLGWRSTFWFLVIWAGMMATILVIFVPETCRAVVGNGSVAPARWNTPLFHPPKHEAHVSDDASGEDRKDKRATRPKRPTPLDALKVAGEKETGAIIIFTTMLFGGYVTVLSSLPSQLEHKYHFNSLQVGLCYIAYGAGSLTSRWTIGKLIDWNFRRHAKKQGIEIVRNQQVQLISMPLEKARLEITLPVVYCASIMIAGYGWTMNYKVNLAGPLIMLFSTSHLISGATSTLITLLIDCHALAAAVPTIDLTERVSSAVGAMRSPKISLHTSFSSQFGALRECSDPVSRPRLGPRSSEKYTPLPMSLLTLPAPLLEDILGLALDLSSPRNTQGFNVDIGYPSSFQGRAFTSAVLSIFLTSRRIYDIVAPLVYKKTYFSVRKNDAFEYFLRQIGPTNRENIRYIMYVDLWTDMSFSREANRVVIFLRRWIDLLLQLPVALRELSLSLPEDDWQTQTEKDDTYGRLRAAVQRFRHLEALSLYNPSKSTPWDFLYTSKVDAESGGDSFVPAFPYLEKLYISGLISKRIYYGGAIYSIPDDRSPPTDPRALSTLRLQVDENSQYPQPDSTFISDLFRALPPLKSFKWVMDKEEPVPTSFVTQFLTDAHLTALTTQHGGSIQHLELNLDGHLNREWLISADAVAHLLVHSPHLQNATIRASFLDFTRLLEAINLYGELPCSLENLCLSLASREEDLEAELSSGRLQTLCSNTQIWRACHERLFIRLTLGRKPEFDYARLWYKRNHRQNPKEYPELQQSLAACIRASAGKVGASSDAWACRIRLENIHDNWMLWPEEYEE